MPWVASDAKRFTRRATNAVKSKKWAKYANAALRVTGSSELAIRYANRSLIEELKRTPLLLESLPHHALPPEEKQKRVQDWLARIEKAVAGERAATARAQEQRTDQGNSGHDLHMRQAHRELSAKGGFEAFRRAYSALRRAGHKESANSLAKAYPHHFKKWAHEAYPEIAKLGRDFQVAINRSNPRTRYSHRMGLDGREEGRDLHQAARKVGLNPAIFLHTNRAVDPRDLESWEGKRRKPRQGEIRRGLALQITRLHGGTFAHGNGKVGAAGWNQPRRRRNDWGEMETYTPRHDSWHGRWFPQAQQFPHEQAAQAAAEGMNYHMPKLNARVRTYTRELTHRGTHGYEMRKQPAWAINLTHRKLGAPYPEGSREAAEDEAKALSRDHDVNHHVVHDHDTGRYAVRRQYGDDIERSLEGSALHATYRGGRRSHLVRKHGPDPYPAW